MGYVVKEDFPGSPDGFHVINFKKGEPFTHTGDLLKVALENDWVEDPKNPNPKKPAKAKKATQTDEEKAAEAKKLAIDKAESALRDAKQALEDADDEGKEAAQKNVDDAQAALDALTAE